MSERQMTEQEALLEYDSYQDTHKGTKADPLRTFSGWLHKFKVKIVDLSEEEALTRHAIGRHEGVGKGSDSER